MDDRLIVKKPVEIVMDSLPPKLVERIEPAWESDSEPLPDLLDKPQYGIKQYRTRILPTRKYRLPRRFWSKDRGFYEVGAGVYGGLDRAQVRFMMAGNQQVANGGKYNQAVNAVLSSVQKRRPRLVHIPVAEKTYAQLYLRLRAPDPEQMAKELLWLIENTLFEFQKFPGAW